MHDICYMLKNKTYSHRALVFFPECVAKGSRLTSVRMTLLLVSATVRNRAHGNRGRKVAVSMGEATKTCLSRRVRRCAHVVLRGRRGTL